MMNMETSVIYDCQKKVLAEEKLTTVEANKLINVSDLEF